MRVAVTAMGVVSAHGIGVGPLEAALREGRSGVRAVTKFDTSGLCSSVAAEAPVLGPRALLDAAVAQALEGRAWAPSTRRGAILATAKGELTKHDDPFSTLCESLAYRCGARGPTRTVGAACASSSAAIGEAFDLINSGLCDQVVVAGVEALHRFVYAGFHALKALSDEPARPFDEARRGLSMGEAAVALVLERSGPALGWVDGFGAATDAHDQTAPHPSGDGLLRACRVALGQAELTPAQIGRYHAHGTATLHNDRMEAAVCEQLFGPRGVPVTAVKGSVGHTLGAAGALDAVACWLALRRRELWPIAGLRNVDHRFNVDCVREVRSLPSNTALVATAGFGGINTAMVLSV